MLIGDPDELLREAHIPKEKKSNDKGFISSNENRMWVSKISNYIIAFFLLSFTVMGNVVYFNIRNNFGSPLTESTPVFKKELHIELGDSAIIAPQYFLENPDKFARQMDLFKVSSELKTSSNYRYYDTGYVTTKGKQYLDVGAYSITFIYKNKDYNCKLIVEDNKAPAITDYSPTVYIAKGEKINENSIFNIKDYSDFTVNYEGLNNVNINKLGMYPITVSATDEYGNQTKKQFYVKVINKRDDSSLTSGVQSSMSGQTKTFSSMLEAQEYGQNALSNGSCRGYSYYTNSDGTVTVTFK